ncbi:hypothetical protein CYMTET_36446, partial [Cymbomonas tetramitiformis]
ENILRGVFSLPESVLLTTDLLALVRAAPRMNPGVKTARELVAMYATMVQAHAHQALALSFARPLVQDTPNDLGTSMPWQEKHFVQLQLVRINCNRPPKAHRGMMVEAGPSSVWAVAQARGMMVETGSKLGVGGVAQARGMMVEAGPNSGQHSMGLGVGKMLVKLA